MGEVYLKGKEMFLKKRMRPAISVVQMSMALKTKADSINQIILEHNIDVVLLCEYIKCIVIRQLALEAEKLWWGSLDWYQTWSMPVSHD